MARHVFGGGWTNEKLECLRKYLEAYTTIFHGNAKANYYSTIYVDAFAGTGQRVDAKPSQSKTLWSDFETDEDAQDFKDGSAKIALEVEPSFNQYVFVESHAGRIQDLKVLSRKFPAKEPAICIEKADANVFVTRWCKETDWRRHRAVVFLDPYGMQVDWATIEAIAGTKAIDMWLLFPLGMAVNRLLTNDQPPPREWAEALTRIFGKQEWQEYFYKKRSAPSLFEIDECVIKDADFNKIRDYFLDRLRSVFAGVAPNPRVLKNSRGVPIYLLCFAAGNQKGAPTAIKIAKHILSASEN